MYNAIICRYNEIATKGNNRIRFEQCLMDNIRFKIKSFKDFKVHRVHGRIWIAKVDKSVFSIEEIDGITTVLKSVFGIENFSPAIMTEPDIAEIEKIAIASAKSVMASRLSENSDMINFRVRARRGDKRFPLSSRDIEIYLTTQIDNSLENKRLKVNLKNAEFTLGCEIREKFALIYWDSYSGSGGLPVGSNPPVLTLLSGGIDSPVAAYMLMKRGCSNFFLTFHSSPYTPFETVDKVRRVALVLDKYQSSTTLYACNLAPMQKLIRDCCLEKNRTVLYRRAMFRIAEMLANKIGAKALVTGEAVGQVASQTLINLNTISSVTEMIVLRPLIGFDKIETIKIAEKIDTMKFAEEQVPDSCTVFAPTSVATAVPIGIAKKEEDKIPEYLSIIEKIVDDIEIIT